MLVEDRVPVPDLLVGVGDLLPLEGDHHPVLHLGDAASQEAHKDHDHDLDHQDNDTGVRTEMMSSCGVNY